MTATDIHKEAQPVAINGGMLIQSSIKQGCAYTLTLSFGNAATYGTKIDQVYLTNDTDGKRTEIPTEKTLSSNISVDVQLYVTAAGKAALGIQGNTIDVPHVTNTDYNWQQAAQFDAVDIYAFNGDDFGSAHFRDVATHTPDKERFPSKDSPATIAHETLHGLHNAMRNKAGDGRAFFYAGDGKGIYVIEPKPNMTDVRNHIGESFKTLASYNYNTYLINQAAQWPNTLYIFDEWNAYVTTMRTAVEVKRAGRWDSNDNADPLRGFVDLLYFCSAAILSIENVDASYLSTNTQYKAAYAMIAEQGMQQLNAAKSEPIWSDSAAWKCLENFRTAQDAENIRGAVKKLMGETWTKRVLGF